MIDFTSNAVVKQMKAMACTKYKIGIFNRKEKRMLNKDSLIPEEVMTMLPWLKYQNVNGNDIFITQAINIDRALLLVDDLDRPLIEAMRLRGVAPSCVVETSPGNFQAWVSLGPAPMSKPERKATARLLAEQFDGDMASADASHYGRLAGFTNRKEKYLTSAGYPFVKCREADGGDAERSLALREWARTRCLESSGEAAAKLTHASKKACRGHRGDPAATFELYFAEWARNATAGDKSMDISRGDFAVVCRMLKEGYDKEQITFGLFNSSPNIHVRKKNHINDYIKRTITAAERMI